MVPKRKFPSLKSVVFLLVVVAGVVLIRVAVGWGAFLNNEGLAVVRLAGDEYSRIVSETPVVTDKAINDYASKVASALIPKGSSFEKGVSLSVTILDKPMPEVYSMADGKVVLTSGALLSLENEAQLAAVMAHEVSHILGSHYPSIYQAFKAEEKKQRGKMLAAGLGGVIVGQAIDYAVQVKTDEIYYDLDNSDIGYQEAMRRITALEAGAGTLEGFADVYQSLPPETKAGSGDPRIPLEMVADSESLVLLAKAGYDPAQAGTAWRRLRKEADKVREGSTEGLAMAFLPPQFKTLLSGVSGPMGGIRAEALTRTISQNPPDRPAFLDSLARSKEITALTGGRKLRVGDQEFKKAIGAFVLGDARAAFKDGNWAESKRLFQAAWNAGYRTAEVAYSLGRSQVGEFAFAASEREKEASEEYLLEAVKLDPGMPEPYRALGELYGEWERYDEAVKMYEKYLKAAPKAKDKSRIEREIEKMNRKTGR